MKKHDVLHPELARVIATLGHGVIIPVFSQMIEDGRVRIADDATVAVVLG